MESSVVWNLKMREIGSQKIAMDDVIFKHIRSLGRFDPAKQQLNSPNLSCKLSVQDGVNFFAMAFENGSVHIRKVTDQWSPIVDSSLKMHHNAVFDVCWITDQQQILTASGDQTSVLLDVAGPSPRVVKIFSAHCATVLRVVSCPGSPSEFATCGRDGRIIMWDTRSNFYQDAILEAHTSATRRFHSNSVLDLKYIDSNHLISCGNADGSIKIWDTRRTHRANKKSMASFTMKNPFANKVFLNITPDPIGNQFYVSSSCNHIFRYKYNETAYERRYGGAGVNSTYVRISLSPDGEYLASGSLDNNAYIWRTKPNKLYALPLAKLTGHTEPVTSVTWASSNKIPLIITCADDNKELMWGLQSCNSDGKEMKNIGRVEIMKHPNPIPDDDDDFLVNVPQLSPSENTPIKLGEKRSTPMCTMTPHLYTPTGSRLTMHAYDENTFHSSPSAFLQNLPNFVVDGNSPGNSVSPRWANRKENINWLSQLSKNSPPIEERSRPQNSSGKKRHGVSDTGKKRKAPEDDSESECSDA